MCSRCKAINCFPRIYALRFCLFFVPFNTACDNQFHNLKLKMLSEEMIKNQYAYILNANLLRYFKREVRNDILLLMQFI